MAEVETVYPDGIWVPNTTNGFIMVGAYNQAYTQIGIIISHPQITPNLVFYELLGYNQTNDEGIINIKLVKDGDLWRGYGDHIQKLNSDTAQKYRLY